MFKYKFGFLFVFLALLISFFRFFTLIVNAQELVITGNADGSDSTVNIQSTTTSDIQQTNNASDTNQVNSDSATGGNQVTDSSQNSNITTGDSSLATQVSNKDNVSVVQNPCCNANTKLDVSVNQNGANSQNSVSGNIINVQNVTISQTSDISNNISGSTDTGSNKVSNSNGSSTISTGSVFAKASILNDPVNIYHVTAGITPANVNISNSNNGDGSQNIIAVLVNNLSNINANNQASINNNFKWDLNSGKNNIEGNNGNVKITTGDVFFDLFLQNNINEGSVSLTCCQTIVPGGNNGDGGEQHGGSGGNSSSGNSSGSSSSSSSNSGPSVLGLSYTGGIFSNPVNFWIGIIMLTFGINLIGKNLLLRTSNATKG